MSDPTFEQRIIAARRQLDDACRELEALRRGDYSGADPLPIQADACDQGIRVVKEARNVLAPAMHRCHESA